MPNTEVTTSAVNSARDVAIGKAVEVLPKQQIISQQAIDVQPQINTVPTVSYTEVHAAQPVQVVHAGYEARVLFSLGSDELLVASNAELDEIANVMASTPNLNLQIQGHASAAGDEFYNLYLSTRRAEAVRDALMERGVAGNRLSHKGYGEYQLKDTVNPNSSENRRVEMVLDFSNN